MAVVIAALGFVLRALVPAGFMPDASALQAGHIELTLCSPGGASARAVTVDWSPPSRMTPSADAPASAASDHPNDPLADGTECPFSLIAAQGIIAPPELAVAMVAAPFAPVAEHHAPLALALPAQGPPLGSRAPPTAA